MTLENLKYGKPLLSPVYKDISGVLYGSVQG